VGFAAVYLAGAFLPAALLNVLTDGGYYYHIVTVHELPWFAERFIGYARDFLGSFWPWVGVGMAGILGALALDLWEWARRRDRPAVDVGVRAAPHAPVLLAAYLALSLAAATGVGTLGGNHNHLLEWAAAGCLGFGLVIAGLRRLPGLAGAGGAAAIFVVLALQVGDLYRTPGWMGYELRVPPESVAEGWRNVTQYVTNDPGPVYSDNVGLLLNARKRLWSTDPFTQTHATFFGRWDESALVDAIRRQAFSLIVLRVDVFNSAPPAAGVPCAAQTSDQGDVSPCIQDAVRTAYVLDQRNVEFIYKPRK
jgi:hypothetical protein